MRDLLELLRPQQWVKNIFVLIPLVFSRQFVHTDLIVLALEAVGVFVLASSSVYVLNDLIDLKRDRLHPEKKKRPIASKRVSIRQAWILWAVLFVLTLLTALIISWFFFFVVMGYLLMTIAYSCVIKKILFLDVILIALGFVFRVLGGGIAIGVMVTDWMIILVFLFTLFLAISKRRQEIKNLEKRSKKTREVLTKYSINLIDQLNAIIVPIVLTSYIFYTFSARQDNPYFIATIPLLVYCFFRYLYLIRYTPFGESSSDYLKDWQLLGVGLFWFILAMAGLMV